MGVILSVARVTKQSTIPFPNAMTNTYQPDARLISWHPVPWFLRSWGRLASLLVVLFISGTLQAQTGPRPRIGLTLSGGGARGLAHIGLLRALDSAGVHVDYVSGTSMGAVVGSLYAVGYSGAEIEQIARKLDWAAVLSNDPSLATVPLPERPEYNRYLAELPLAAGKFQLSKGIIESEELWLTLSELFFPYYRTKSFDQFYRPFRCVATDVLEGEPVVLDQGEVAPAVRASMAIPSVFAPVQYGNRTLVDGGVVRNFPVSDAKAMGADYIIGSNVSAGAYTAANLLSPIDVMLQISSFKDNADFKAQKALCNVLVEYPLGTYTSGSFTAAEPIIAIGLAQGRTLVPRLQALRDSLDRVYGPQPMRPTPPRADSVYFASYAVRGLTAEQAAHTDLMLQWMQLPLHRYYTAPQLSQALRRAYGTRYLRKMTYALQPLKGDSVHIVFDVELAPRTNLHLGLQYNSAVGIGMVTALSSRDFLLPSSISRVALNLGENPRLRLHHLQSFTHHRSMYAQLLAQGEQVEITPYDPNFSKAGLYRQRYGRVELQAAKILRADLSLGLGARYEHLGYQPEVTTRLQATGRLRQVNSYAFLEANTLNGTIYPTRGIRIEAELGAIHAQHSTFRVENTETQERLLMATKPFGHSQLNAELYHPVSRKSTFMVQVQAGVNVKSRQAFANDFFIGGLNRVLRNQITFAGLPDAGLFTGSAAVGLLGYRWTLTRNLYGVAKANVLYHDFVANNLRLQPAAVHYGGVVSLCLKSFIGPLEASLMYSDLAKKVLPYFNLGIPFGYR